MTSPVPAQGKVDLGNDVSRIRSALDLMLETEHVNMAEHLSRVVTAHDAVAQGIATHAQKETVARDERRRRLEAERKLQAGTDATP